ncbi:hypothetical protein DSM3645_22149 [Blastopirellula marina DSM 3645]|uniref:Uncharacterized protein n=1 Tax=Blastopirellula marina DSM 3645 TaxID=314230 RepID=A3ZUH8_9BACT|nr:hypothetical protein DSM3645_22149 [Blastopirellula marina DSM 3645]
MLPLVVDRLSDWPNMQLYKQRAVEPVRE